MPALDQGAAEMLLTGLTGVGSYVATSGSLKLRLTINAPTATVAGTQLSGTGYTTGGSTATWAAATGTASGAVIANTNTFTWTNGGGSAATWNVVGLELWDATPARKCFGLWTAQPYLIGPGSQFVVAPGALAISFP